MSTLTGGGSLRGQQIGKGRGLLFQKLLPFQQKSPVSSNGFSENSTSISSLCFTPSKQSDGSQFDDDKNNHGLGNFDESYHTDCTSSKSKNINLAKFLISKYSLEEDQEDEDQFSSANFFRKESNFSMKNISNSNNDRRPFNGFNRIDDYEKEEDNLNNNNNNKLSAFVNINDDLNEPELYLDAESDPGTDTSAKHHQWDVNDELKLNSGTYFDDDDSKQNQSLSSIRMDNSAILLSDDDDDESRTDEIKRNSNDLIDENDESDEEKNFIAEKTFFSTNDFYTNGILLEKTKNKNEESNEKNKNVSIMKNWNKEYSSIVSFTSSSNSVAKSVEANPESNPLTVNSGTEHCKFNNTNKNNLSSSSSSFSPSYSPRHNQSYLENLAEKFAATAANNNQIRTKTIFNRRKIFALTDGACVDGFRDIRVPLFAFNNKRPKKFFPLQKKDPNITIKKDYVFERKQTEDEEEKEEKVEEIEDEETKNLKFIERFKRMISSHHKVLAKDEEDNATNLNRIAFNQLESAQIYFESKSPDDILPPIESFRMMLRTTLTTFQNYETNLLQRFHLQNLTAIQQYIIPNIVNGSVDLLVSAPTGTGKTLAYLMSVVQLICEYRGIGDCPSKYRLSTAHPLALIIVPTHELANQIYKTLRLLVEDLPIRLMYFYGSQNLTDQIRLIEKGLDIVISTPGRFLHLIEIKQLFFRKFKFIFIDEIDNVLASNKDLKHDLIYSKFCHLMENANDNPEDIDDDDVYVGPPDMKLRIQNQFKRPRFFLFSATVDGKTRVKTEQFVAPNYAFFVMGDKAKISSLNIEQIFIPINDMSNKNVELVKLLEKFYTRYDQILIFVNKIQHADRLSDFLKQKQFQSVSIHSNLPQKTRDQAIEDFRNKTVRIAVSTFLMSRGLNISDLRCTILFDLPQNLTDYINCIGRTGRMGNVGISVTLFQTYLKPNLALVQDLINLLEDSNQSIPQFLLDLQNNPVATYGISRNK